MALKELRCFSNQITSLDVSTNSVLKSLHCYSNQLTSLDLSNNSAFVTVKCNDNLLTSLNLKNGYNAILSSMDFTNNPNLTCILVDDVAYSDANWAAAKDAIASYRDNCPSLGTTESVFNTIAVYPNPTKGEVHIDNVILEKATVYDSLGKLVKTTTFANASNNNIINLAGLPSGLYYIYLESQETTIMKKIVVE